jgi:hypothetical protein
MSLSGAMFVKWLFFGIIIALSATTSFLFFVEVFQFGRGFILDPFWSAILTGVIGVIVLDGAALAWMKIYLSGSDNNDLRFLATVGTGIGAVGSAISSFAYLIMVAADGYQPGSDIRTYVQVTMAAIIVAHFVLVFLSGYFSTSAKIDERAAEMMSEATEEMLTLTEADFRAQIPRLAQSNADRMVRTLAGRFESLTVFDNGNDAARQELPQPQRERSGQGSSANGHRPGGGTRDF